MSATIVQTGLSLLARRADHMPEPEREPRLCRRELGQMAMEGIFPGEQRLEHLLDRIERAS